MEENTDSQSDLKNTIENSPELDEEGYSIRPEEPGYILSLYFKLNFHLLSERKHFYSSSESEEEEESHKKFNIKIKPLQAKDILKNAATVDELKASIGNIALSPSPVVSEEVARPRRSTPTPELISKKPPEDTTALAPLFGPPLESAFVEQKTEGNDQSATEVKIEKLPSINDLDSIFGPVLSPKSVAVNAEDKWVHFSDTSPERVTPELTPREKVVSPPAASDNPAESPPPGPPGPPGPSGPPGPPRNVPSPLNLEEVQKKVAEQNVIKDDYLETISSPKDFGLGQRATPPPPPPPTYRTVVSSPGPGSGSGAGTTSVSEDDVFYDKLPSFERRCETPAGSSRGPSPLTMGAQDTLPVAAAFTETVNAYFKGADPSNDNTQNDANAKEFWVNMPNLMTHLKKVSEQKPQATYYNVDMLKYQVSAQGIQSTPLNLAVNWRCEPASTDLRIDYKYNTDAMTTAVALNNVQFLVPVDGGVTKLQAVLPPAVWNADQQRILWKIPDISQKSENGGVGSLLARFQLSEGPSKPSPLVVQFTSEGSTLSGCDIELVGAGYRFSLIKKRFAAGPTKHFPVVIVNHILKDVLTTYLQEEQYEPELCRQMTKTISEVIKAQVKDLMIPRYKLIVIVHIGQLTGQSILIGSRCLWDPKNDAFASFIFRNSSLFALANVYTVYFE
ncbi:hypothetical protein G4228_013808 [Cervus hanglu yarkandensis]|nr:hypothetical protein G4228_013048 [Cervus hanglu yarkandensis]KAF4021705.1 hypothetical protein G4228_013808 [Cervus hanglu yarkandensis]